MSQDNHGTSFGNQVHQYASARRGVPDEVLASIAQRAGEREGLLDLGCGTGISTRQLAKSGFDVTGADIDDRMIEQALKDSTATAIRYFVCPASHLSFPNDSFEIVTAISSFNWFCNSESVSEIKRVLMNAGLFVAVNKNYGDFFRKIIGDSFPLSNIPPARQNYNPVAMLTESGFTDVITQVVSSSERFTLDEMTLFVQSTSLWNLIPETVRDRAIKYIRMELAQYLTNEIIELPLEINVVSGYKG